MSRLIHLLLSVFAIGGLTQDAGLYINRVQLLPRSNADNHYTFMTSDSYKAPQRDQYPNEKPSIGSLYEDDLSPQTTACTNTECPKLTKIFSYVIMDGNSVSNTRIGDASLAAETKVEGLPLGYLAPYPGYCSSDEKVPVVELYSMAKKDQKHVYWTPLNPTQYIAPNMEATTFDKYQVYNQARLVGYALENQPSRLILENGAPDFMKPTGKANFTHFAYEAHEIIRYTKDNKEFSIAGPTMLGWANLPERGTKFKAATGAFVFGKPHASVIAAATKTCGTLLKLWNYCTSKTDFSQCRIGVTADADLMKPLVAVAPIGDTLKSQSAQCGGMKGLYPLTELEKDGVYRYTTNPDEHRALFDDGFLMTRKFLGFVPLQDNYGFFLLDNNLGL